MDAHLVKKSKKMSLALRHDPGQFGLDMDTGGWVLVSELAKALRITPEDIKNIVNENDKGRFGFNTHQTKIRALQGHSISVDLGLVAKIPPEVLYHGTAWKNVESIMKTGIIPGKRNHVHMSVDVDTAIRVGSRHSVVKPVILEIDCVKMLEDGHSFFMSENGVWLSDHVPSEYIHIKQ